jgi:hypothetical protein
VRLHVIEKSIEKTMENEFSAMPVAEQDRRDRRSLLSLATYLEPTEPRWADAPVAVRYARNVAIVSTVCFSLVAAYMLGEILCRDRALPGISVYHLLFLGVSMLLAPINLWLIGALKKGRRSAWGVQRATSYIGLSFLPVGTALHLLLLLRWSRFETRAWFIVQ